MCRVELRSHWGPVEGVEGVVVGGVVVSDGDGKMERARL